MMDTLVAERRHVKLPNITTTKSTMRSEIIKQCFSNMRQQEHIKCAAATSPTNNGDNKTQLIGAMFGVHNNEKNIDSRTGSNVMVGGTEKITTATATTTIMLNMKAETKGNKIVLSSSGVDNINFNDDDDDDEESDSDFLDEIEDLQISSDEEAELEAQRISLDKLLSESLLKASSCKQNDSCNDTNDSHYDHIDDCHCNQSRESVDTGYAHSVQPDHKDETTSERNIVTTNGQDEDNNKTQNAPKTAAAHEIKQEKTQSNKSKKLNKKPNVKNGVGTTKLHLKDINVTQDTSNVIESQKKSKNRDNSKRSKKNLQKDSKSTKNSFEPSKSSVPVTAENNVPCTQPNVEMMTPVHDENIQIIEEEEEEKEKEKEKALTPPINEYSNEIVKRTIVPKDNSILKENTKTSKQSKRISKKQKQKQIEELKTQKVVKINKNNEILSAKSAINCGNVYLLNPDENADNGHDDLSAREKSIIYACKFCVEPHLEFNSLVLHLQDSHSDLNNENRNRNLICKKTSRKLHPIQINGEGKPQKKTDKLTTSISSHDIDANIAMQLKASKSNLILLGTIELYFDASVGNEQYFLLCTHCDFKSTDIIQFDNHIQKIYKKYTGPGANANSPKDAEQRKMQESCQDIKDSLLESTVEVAEDAVIDCEVRSEIPHPKEAESSIILQNTTDSTTVNENGSMDYLAAEANTVEIEQNTDENDFRGFEEISAPVLDTNLATQQNSHSHDKSNNVDCTEEPRETFLKEEEDQADNVEVMSNTTARDQQTTTPSQLSEQASEMQSNAPHSLQPHQTQLTSEDGNTSTKEKVIVAKKKNYSRPKGKKLNLSTKPRTDSAVIDSNSEKKRESTRKRKSFVDLSILLQNDEEETAADHTNEQSKRKRISHENEKDPNEIHEIETASLASTEMDRASSIKTDTDPSYTKEPGVSKRFKEKIQCEVCGKGFERTARYKEHMRLHTGEKPFECEECGRKFRIKTRLQEHLLRHRKIKNHICDICQRAWATKADLLQHKRHHAQDKRYACSHCGKGFVRSSDLKIHVRIHTNEKPFECETCHKKFRANQNLIVHKKSHSNDRPFKCDDCGKSFIRKIDLKVHSRVHTGNYPDKCHICDRVYSSRAHVRAHIEREHTEKALHKTKKTGRKPKVANVKLPQHHETASSDSNTEAFFVSFENISKDKETVKAKDMDTILRGSGKKRSELIRDMQQQIQLKRQRKVTKTAKLLKS